jgi:hypothetical protein
VPVAALKVRDLFEFDFNMKDIRKIFVILFEFNFNLKDIRKIFEV